MGAGGGRRARDGFRRRGRRGSPIGLWSRGSVDFEQINMSMYTSFSGVFMTNNEYKGNGFLLLRRETESGERESERVDSGL